MNDKPIIVIDDDNDDLEIIESAFEALQTPNEIIFFNDANQFLDFMKTTNKKPFLVICDVNMHGINGLELKARILKDDRLREKCIPFIFFSTSRASRDLAKAYSLNVQGYFIKPDNFEELKKVLQAIIVYWEYSHHPHE